jgi:DNA-binding NarL/FixJ family response regulator
MATSSATVALTGFEGYPSGLTRRESEIALHIAGGLTNRQIAETLVVSVRTVDSHVAHVLYKLGVSSRSQIAAWVAEHRPAAEPVG